VPLLAGVVAGVPAGVVMIVVPFLNGDGLPLGLTGTGMVESIVVGAV
jgi:hypothetical protein